jgi:hypothetical protein
MPWFKIFLITMYSLSIIAVVLLIDEEREPITKGRAVVEIILNAFLIIGIIYYL